MRYFLMLSLLVGVFLNLAWTQESDNRIFLNNATIYPADLSNTASRDLIEWPTNNCTDEGCYAIIQLEDIPNATQRSILSNAGISLQAYIPNKAYLATYTPHGAIQLPDFITAVIPLQGINKRPSSPFSLSNGPEEEETYYLVGLAFPDVYPIQLAAALTQLGAEITHLDNHQLHYSIAANLLPDVLNCPLLLYTEDLPVAPSPEGRIGRSNLRLKGVNQGPGMGFDGTGISIAIGDDGSVHHLDFHGRIIDHTRFNSGTHGEMTVGMAAGDGNIDQAAEGAAPGARVHLFDIGNYEHITDAVSNFIQYGIVITSTSYGEGCGNNYSLSTQSIDKQVHENPQLLHCFSAGNHANSPCANPYSWLGPNAAGTFYSTITGGRKAGKNVLAIGNNQWNDIILPSSSLGPTPDGRIKPDLCALGQSDYTTGDQNSYRQSSGTSAAAPNVAGALACLYQYYKETYNHYPSSALIKALALNTADDQGAAGPDFNYGWGRLNAGNALESLMQTQYFESQITHGQQHSFQFPVPTGAKRLKVMLYWHDAAGSVLASRALVNDLDLTLRTPSSAVKLPWVPNSSPHLDSLALPAQPGVDRINNVEQVVVNAPTPGYYNVLIDGYQVPMGTQSYVIVYQIETAPIEVISPQAGSSFVPQEMTLISWDAVGNEGSFSIDFSLNNGQNWQSLATNIPGDQRNYLWTVPALTNAEFKIKVKRAAHEGISEGMAVIAPTPMFDVQYLNSNQASISWNPIVGASSYKIYLLGEKHMEIVAAIGGTSYLLPAVVGQEYWISVAPVFDNKIGRRANARIYQHYGCDRYVTLDIQFDQHPNETSWYILDQNGAILEQGGPYTNAIAHSSISLNICLPPGCYTLAMADTYNDGLCCNDGNGHYSLTSINGNILVEGGQFDNFAYSLFCPEEPITNLLAIEAQVIQHVSCFGEQNGIATISANGGSGNYNYQWSNGAQGNTVQNLAAGVYQVTVSDGATSQVQNVQINQPPAFTINYTTQDAVCSDGAITLSMSGGNAPYSYNWMDANNNQSFRQNLEAGNYFVIVTDANGCMQTATININPLNALQLEYAVNNPSCSNGNDGSITTIITGGHGNYQLQWSNGTQNENISGLIDGTYSLTVTSGNCQVEQTFTLTSPAGFSIMANQSNPSCSSTNDATINLLVSGGLPPYSYQWSNGVSTSFNTNLGAGSYFVTLTDANNCSTSRGYQITAPTLLEVATTVTPAQVGIGGSATLDITGGSSPYFTQWVHGPQEANLSNLAPGYYSAFITDAQGCSVSTFVTILEQDPNPNTDDLVYCDMAGASTNYEWIESVSVNGVDYPSGNNHGFGDYTNITISLTTGVVNNIDLLPAYSLTHYNEHWVVWIDYNHDGDFNDYNEKVVDLGSGVGLMNTNFTIPTTALAGDTRMRIAMQYAHAAELCSNLNYGEVEDYTVEISPLNNVQPIGSSLVNTDVFESQQWIAYPNPFSNKTTIQGTVSEDSAVSIQVFNGMGQKIKEEKHLANKGNFNYQLEMEDMESGTYFIKIIDMDGVQKLTIIKI